MAFLATLAIAAAGLSPARAGAAEGTAGNQAVLGLVAAAAPKNLVPVPGAEWPPQ